MAWTVEISAFAQKQLARLDRPAAARILDWLESRLEGPGNPRYFGEPLRGELAGLWRYRIGDFRVICEIQDNRLLIHALSIGHRREIYRRR